jgi:hypothetical protein
MTIKKEHLIGGIIVVGVAIYLISKRDGVLDSASINNSEPFDNFSGEDDSYGEMAVTNVFPTSPTLTLTNLKK